MKLNLDSNVISDNEGIVVETSKGLIKQYVDAELKGTKAPTPKLSTRAPQIPIVEENIDALKWSPENEKVILRVLYKRYGSGTGTDFSSVSPKIASTLARIYKVSDLNSLVVEAKLKSYIELSTLNSNAKASLSITEDTNTKVDGIDQDLINLYKSLREGSYKHCFDGRILDKKELDVCVVMSCKHISFTYSESKKAFILACPFNKPDCVLNASLTDQEQPMLELFTQNLKDADAARKLIFLMRTQKEQVKKVIPKKKGSKK